MPEQTLTFDGDVVIVTGAGNGIGRAYALELGRRGARVVVNDIGTDQYGTDASGGAAQAVVAEIRQAGGTAVADTHSVAERAGGTALVQTALEAFGRVDAVVHNAGFSKDNFFEELTDEQIDSVLDVHLRGAFYVAQPAYAAMKASGNGGRLVFTASTAGLLGAPLMSNYGAGKMGVVGLARSIAIEGAQHGIKANVISPGALTRRGHDPDAFRYKNRPNPIDVSNIPGAELFTPERVAPIAVVLTHRSCEVTGEIFMARSGWFARAWIAASDGWISGDHIEAEDLLAHWDEITGATRGGSELPLDGPGWSSRFMHEKVKPLLGQDRNDPSYSTLGS